MKSVEIVSLIYRSVSYLDFIVAQLKHPRNLVDGWDVSVRVVANDPNPTVWEALQKTDIPYTLYKDPTPSDYYINRVYRAMNFATYGSAAENVCLINSDMGFSDGWLSNLLKHHDGINIPCSRLVESGRLISHNPITISKGYGKHPGEYDEAGFLTYASQVAEDRVSVGGTYAPVLLNKERLKEAGGFPEGNLYEWPNGEVVEGKWFGKTFNSKPPDATFCGDDYLMKERLEKKFGMKQITVCDSIVYHFQSGELYE